MALLGTPDVSLGPQRQENLTLIPGGLPLPPPYLPCQSGRTTWASLLRLSLLGGGQAERALAEELLSQTPGQFSPPSFCTFFGFSPQIIHWFILN